MNNLYNLPTRQHQVNPKEWKS